MIDRDYEGEAISLLTEFAYNINPKINKNRAYDLVETLIRDGGLDVFSVVIIGTAIRESQFSSDSRLTH